MKVEDGKFPTIKGFSRFVPEDARVNQTSSIPSAAFSRFTSRKPAIIGTSNSFNIATPPETVHTNWDFSRNKWYSKGARRHYYSRPRPMDPQAPTYHELSKYYETNGPEAYYRAGEVPKDWCCVETACWFCQGCKEPRDDIWLPRCRVCSVQRLYPHFLLGGDVPDYKSYWVDWLSETPGKPQWFRIPITKGMTNGRRNQRRQGFTTPRQRLYQETEANMTRRQLPQTIQHGERREIRIQTSTYYRPKISSI